jgi:hypothetical protein
VSTKIGNPSVSQYDDSPSTRTIQRAEIDLSTLHLSLNEIDNISTLSKQERITKSLELLTQLTNSAATAYFYVNNKNTLAVGPRVISKQALGWSHDVLATLHAAAKKSLETSKVNINRLEGKNDVTIIAAPSISANGEHCALVQLLQLNTQPVESFVVILQLYLGLLKNQNAQGKSNLNQDLKHTQIVLLSNTLSGAQHALVNHIASEYPDVVAWTGFVEKSSIQFGAISNSQQLNKRGVFASSLNQAMIECLKINKAIYESDSQKDQPESPIIKQAHKTLSKKYFNLIPIRSSDKQTVMIIGLASDNKEQINLVADEFDIGNNILGDVLMHKPSGMLGRYRELKHSLFDSSKKWLAPAIILTPLTLLCLLMLPVTYKVDAPVVIEPIEKRFIAAPFKSVLKKVFVTPGDIVKPGDLLAELDDRELKWKFSQLQAEYEGAIKQKDIEMASGDTAKMQLSKYEAAQFKAKMDLLQYQLDNLKLISPIGGQLISGDIKKREGSAITIGDALFEIALLDKVIVEIEVPADEVSHIEKNMPTSIRINALPNHKWTANLDTIHLRSIVRQDENVFIAELELENELKLIRPGMNGKAKIHTDKKSLGWVLFHRAWNKLIELSFW